MPVAGHTAGYRAIAILRGASSFDRIHCSLLTHYASYERAINKMNWIMRADFLFSLLVTLARIFLWITCFDFIGRRWMRLYLVLCCMKMCWKIMLNGLKKVKRVWLWNGMNSNMKTRLQLIYGKFVWKNFLFASGSLRSPRINFLRWAVEVWPSRIQDMCDIEVILTRYCCYSLSGLQECEYYGLNGRIWDIKMRVGVG